MRCHPSPFWNLNLVAFCVCCSWLLAAELAVNIVDESSSCDELRFAVWMAPLLTALCSISLMPLLYDIGKLRTSRLWHVWWIVPPALIISALVLSARGISQENSCSDHRTFVGFVAASLGVEIVLSLLMVAFFGVCAVDRLMSAMWMRAPVDVNASQTSQSLPFPVDILNLPQALAKFPAVRNAQSLGVLGMCFSPGRKNDGAYRDLRADLTRIHEEYKADIIITLMEQCEIDFMSLQDFPVLCKELGMEWVHYPIHDKWTPDDLYSYLPFIQRIENDVRRGRRVVVHCNGGKGRTGLTVVCTLLLLGVPTVRGAISLTRGCRRGTIYNPIQILFAHEFLASYRHSEKSDTTPLISVSTPS